MDIEVRVSEEGWEEGVVACVHVFDLIRKVCFEERHVLYAATTKHVIGFPSRTKMIEEKFALISYEIHFCWNFIISIV